MADPVRPFGANEVQRGRRHVGSGEYHRKSLFGSRLGRLDELRPVVPHAVDSRADNPRRQGRFRQRVQKVLDTVLVSQIRIQPFREPVGRDNDRRTVMDVPQGVLRGGGEHGSAEQPPFRIILRQ